MGLPQRLEAPVFFTSAAKVKIPFVGDDTRGIDSIDTRYYPISNPLEKHHHEVSKHFVRMVSSNVRFDEGVIEERCSHSLPFKSHDFTKLYLPNFAKDRGASKKKEYPGRFDTAGYNRKVPSHFKKFKYPKAFKQQDDVKPATPQGETGMFESVQRESNFKQSKKSANTATNRKGKTYMSDSITVKDWDQVMLQKLSKDTAHWIVYEGDLAGNQKYRLSRFLRDKYGEKISNTHIVRPDVSETDLRKRNELMELKRMRDAEASESVERRRRAIRHHKEYRKSLAEYYKLPRFLSQQHSNVLTTTNEVNQTAQDVIVKHLEQPPPPKMEDFLVGVAGQYIRSTDNEFEQRMYTEQAKPVHQHGNDKSRVVMDDLTEYKIDVRPRYPSHPRCWTMLESEKKLGKNVNFNRETFSKGLQRWVSLPQPADFMSERGLNPPQTDECQIEQIEYSKLDSIVENRSLVTLVEEWRSKWKLVGQWQDIPISDILIDMDSLHDHIRLGAVAACAMASLHKKPINELAGLAVVPSHTDSTKDTDDKSRGHLPDVLLKKVREKLNDSNERVKLAAAICLYCLESSDDEIFHILKNHMKSGYGCDRLAAAQCLALSGDVSAEVIRIMVRLLMANDDSISSELTASQKEQATMLLVHISKNTNLVHSLLAEQLNSSRWRDRVTACQVIAKLVGNINKDLVHKLTNLMWNDWSSAVRKVAAETLGHTGHGRDIHYELRTKLAEGNETIKVNVLKKLSHLGIMTAALLPTFMACFSDDYVSVRMQVCETAGKLRLSGEDIGRELLKLMEFDPSWKVKVKAISAIKDTGFYSEKSLEALVWALRFEDEAEVRVQACAALRHHYRHNPADDKVLHILQDRALVEPDVGVREEVRNTLKAMDIACLGDNIDMIRQIKSEVKRLCHKGVIAAKIAMYENELDKYQNKVHYMGTNLIEDSQSRPSSNASSSREVNGIGSPRPIATDRSRSSKTDLVRSGGTASLPSQDVRHTVTT